MASPRSFSRIAFGLVTVVTGLALCLGPLQPALAQTVENPVPLAASSPLAVTIAGNLPDAANSTYKNIYTELTRAGVVALTNALQLFLGQMAYDAAEYIATGGKGQGKLFFDGNFGEYLSNVGSDAAGEFMASLSSSSFFQGIGFNLCQPKDPTTLLRLQVSLGDLGRDLFPTPPNLPNASTGGLTQYNRPRPRCEFQAVLDNYDTLFHTMSNGDVIRNLESSFDPAISQLGTMTSVYNRFLTDTQRQVTDAAAQREEGNGFRPLEGLISNNIRTPASVIEAATNEQTVRKPGADQTSMVSSMLSNAWQAGPIQLAMYTGSIFLNTLASKFMQRIFERGLGGSLSSTLSLSLGGPDSVAVYGKTDARNANIDLKNPPPQQVAAYDVVSQMQTCLISQRGAWNCVMDQSLVSAIRANTKEGGVTVREAMDRGMLHGDWRLIPAVRARENQDPQCYTQAYCAGNLQKMRLMRILPIGFEFAANSQTNALRCDSPEGCITLKEVVASFSSCTDDGKIDERHPWCHLIDPNWVITSFPQQCTLTGYSDTLVSSKLPIRKEECQDIQTCLARNDKGECTGGFGYCMAERSVYRFSADVCPAHAASCRIYTDATNKKVGYLRNTIDRAACDASNAGCLWYATRRATSTAEMNDWAANTSTGQRMYFKAASANQTAAIKGLDSCPANEEGCTRLYSFTPGKAALNLMINGSFESQDPTTSTDALRWKSQLSIGSPPTVFSDAPALPMSALSDQAYLGSKAMQLSFGSPRSLLQSVSVVGGRSYSFSFYARSAAGSATLITQIYPSKSPSSIGLGLGFTAAELNRLYHNGIEASDVSSAAAAYRRVLTTELSPDWQRFEYNLVIPTSTQGLHLFIAGNQVLLDAIQLEEGEYSTAYVDTFTEGLKAVFMKIAPEELMCTDKDPEDPTRSPLCDRFAQSCRQLDAGCQGYRDEEAGQEVPAILSENDLCPAACVGYAEYRKSASSFDLVKDVDPRFSDPEEATSTHFIPRTAGQCTQQDVGCEAFTVVDEAGRQDGAAIAYSYLRACEKPATDSETYFTWEGADTVGYQLRTWSLKRDVGPFDLGPRILTKVQADQISFKEPDTCNEASWRTAADPDCRQFYDARGRIFYRYFSQTILSSNNCLSLRLTRTSAADCERTGGRYNERGECTYGAYLPESRSCNAAATGCRMFTGANSGNTQSVMRQSFRDTMAPFETAGIVTSTEALLVGDVSVRVGDPAPAGVPLGYARARTTFDSDELALYRATFWAKAPASSTTLHVRTSREDGGGEAVVGSVRLSPEWQRFTVGLFEGAPDTSSTQLTFTGPLVGRSGYGFYLDEISIVRVQDVVYARNNTWTTPAQCDQGLDGAEEPQAMLNCRTYRNRLNQNVNARRFTRLCREAAIGCSAFVDTRNTDETYERKIVQPNPIDPLRHVPSIITLKADRYVYLIDDPEKRCNALNMSCRAFGKPKLAPDRQTLDSEQPYETVYYKDDVTRYGSALCKPSEAFCAEYKFGSVKEYFRDPGTSVCEYREAQIISGGEGPAETRLGGWYVKGSVDTPCYPGILEGGNAYGMARSGDRSYKGFVGLCEEAAGECIELRDINDVSDPLRRSGKPYFYIKNDRLDTSSCNGTVDLGRGCVLFRDMSSGALNYNAKATYEKYKSEGFKPVTPVDCRNNPENPACVQLGRCGGATTVLTRRLSGLPGTAYTSDADAITETRTASTSWIGTATCRTDDECRAPAPTVLDSTSIAYFVNVGGTPVRRATSTQVVVRDATCQAPRPEQSNDANLLLKVSVDRECSEWLGCRSSETVLDPSTNKYKEICSVPALCDKSTGQAGDQFCASYVDRRSTSTAPMLLEGAVLNADRYSSRLLGLGQKDYSGYTIPDSFQVMDLQSVRVAIDGAKNVPDTQFRLPQDYRLAAAVAMPPVRRVDSRVGGRVVTQYQHAVRPLANQAKVLGEPGNADPSDGLILTNPQLALCKHVATGRIGYFRREEVSGTPSTRTVYCYLPIHTNSDLLDFQNMAEKFSLADPTTNQFLTQAFPPAECRAHPEQDAPFQASFTTEWDSTKNPAKAMRRLAGFANANTCEFGEDCSCTYKRVDYENAAFSKFYNPYSNASPPGICVGGPRDGQGCIPSKIFSASGGNGGAAAAPATGGTGGTAGTETASGARANAIESANTEQLCGPPEMGGQCMPAKAYTIIRGTFGNCLERDLTRTIGSAQGSTPCLTWNPTLLLNGDKDPYHYNQGAGYLPPQNSGSYYCLSDARKPRTVQFQANFFKKDTAGKYSGAISELRFDDRFVSNASGGSGGNNPGSMIDGLSPNGSNVSDQCEYTDDDQDDSGGDAANGKDFSALRLINTGRGAAWQYTESFFKIDPAPFAKGYYDRDETNDDAVKLAISDTAIGFIGLTPIKTPNSTARLACGYNQDWVDDIQTPDYDEIDEVRPADVNWQRKFNADFDGVLTRSSERIVKVPGSESVMVGSCVDTLTSYRGSCFFKTWETGYKTTQEDAKPKFVGLWGSAPRGELITTPSGRVNSFETLRTTPLHAKCESLKPYFSIRTVFQAKVPESVGGSPVTEAQLKTLSPSWTLAGFWVTACAGSGTTDEHYIYMYPRLEYGDICRELAEVVSRNSNQDAAFTDRVWKDGSFTIPVLGITYNARYSPFSSALNTRPPGRDPLFQTGQEVAGYSPLNPPTFLAAGYRTYYTQANPRDKWAYLTNIFARVYRIYNYYERSVANGENACLGNGPNKGKACTPSTAPGEAGTSRNCSLSGRCDVTRVNLSGASDLSTRVCNGLSGLNAGLSCPTSNPDLCHLAPMMVGESGGVQLRQLPCLTQKRWIRLGTQWLNTAAPGAPTPVDEATAAAQGAFRCPNTPASMLRHWGDDSWKPYRAEYGGLAFDQAHSLGNKCTHPTDQDGAILGSEECPERIINTLEIARADGAPATDANSKIVRIRAEGSRRMTVSCEGYVAAAAGRPATPGKCRVQVPRYTIETTSSGPDAPFVMPALNIDPLASDYAYGQCARVEDCSFTQSNYWSTNYNLGSNISITAASSRPTNRCRDYVAIPCTSWQAFARAHGGTPPTEAQCRGLAPAGGMWTCATWNSNTENAEIPWPYANGAVRFPGAEPVSIQGFPRNFTEVSQGRPFNTYEIGGCVIPGRYAGATRTGGVCDGGLKDGQTCSTISVTGSPNADCVGGTPEQERLANICGQVSTQPGGAGTPWIPNPQYCAIDDPQGFLSPQSESAGITYNNDNNACTHDQGYVPRPDLCPNPNDEYCGLIAYNIRNVAASVVPTAGAKMPTDVTLGLHKLSYLIDGRDEGSPTPYSATYIPRPPMIAAPDIQSCPTPGKCAVQGMNKFSLNGSSEGIVSVASSQAKSTMRFYAWASHNQMPLRSITIDWGDSQRQVIADGKLKNHKPYCAARKECVATSITGLTGSPAEKIDSTGLTCNTDNDCPVGGGQCKPVGTCREKSQILCSTDAQCRIAGNPGDKDVCQIRTLFGNSAEACEETYFEFTHLYTCNGPSSLPLCRNAGVTGRARGGSTVPSANVQLQGGCYFGRYESEMMDGRPASDRTACSGSGGSPFIPCIRAINERTGGRLNESGDLAYADALGIACVTPVQPTATNTNHCERDPDRLCDITNPTSCAAGDRCMPNLAAAGGCWDDQVQVCRFTPRVMVQDNWGWCTGECRAVRDSGGGPADSRTGSGPIALHPYGGCYSATPLGSSQQIRDNISSVDEPVRFDNECVASLPNATQAGYLNLRPWVVYPGSINLRSNR